MENIPTPNASERSKAILDILVQKMITDKTLQLSDLKDAYDKLSDQDSTDLIEQAANPEHLLEELSPEHRLVLFLRAQGVVTGTDPFDKQFPSADSRS